MTMYNKMTFYTWSHPPLCGHSPLYYEHPSIVSLSPPPTFHLDMPHISMHRMVMPNEPLFSTRFRRPFWHGERNDQNVKCISHSYSCILILAHYFTIQYPTQWCPYDGWHAGNRGGSFCRLVRHGGLNEWTSERNVECGMHVLAPLLTPHSPLPSPLPFHPSPPLLSLPTLPTLSSLFPVPFPTPPPSSLPLPIPLTTTAIIITHSHSHHTSCHAMEWIYDIFIMDDSFLFFDHVTHWPCHTMSYWIILDHTISH